MCIIVDANLASHVFATPTPPNFQAIFDWIDKRDGIMVFGGKNAEELWCVTEARRRILELARRGKAIQQPKPTVDQETGNVRSLRLCRSDDPHIIALARVSGARVLCSADQNLHADFTDPSLIPSPRGKIYQNAGHKQLLRHSRLCKEMLSLSRLSSHRQ